MKFGRGQFRRLPGTYRFSHVYRWNLREESRTFALFALQPESSPQQHGKIPAKRQPQARAAMAFLERIFDLAEFAEDRFVMLAGDADAGVRDDKQNLIVFHHPRRNRHLSPGRELERVRN